MGMSLTLIFSPTIELLGIPLRSVWSPPSQRLPPSAPRKCPGTSLHEIFARAPWEGGHVAKAGSCCLGMLAGGQSPPGLADPLTVSLFHALAAARAGGCELVHPDAGSGGHHREEGATHQAAGTVCWRLHQGEQGTVGLVPGFMPWCLGFSFLLPRAANRSPRGAVLLPKLETQSCNTLVIAPPCLGGDALAWGHGPHRESLAKAGPRSCFFSPIPLQIAPAEGPDASERMVIITGPPEAQFKVRWSWRQGDLCSLLWF